MAKKDLTAAAARGADLFFSANDAQKTQDTQPAQYTQKPHKAQEEQPAQLAQTVQEMQDAITTRETQKAQEKAARAAEKKASKRRLNIEITSGGYDYVSIMSRITGVSITRYISDLIDREAATNNETYKAAKELINNAR